MQHRQKKWKKFIDQANNSYYVPNKNLSEKSVIEPTQIINRIWSDDNAKSELYKNVTVRKEKKKGFAEIVKVCTLEIMRA